MPLAQGQQIGSKFTMLGPDGVQAAGSTITLTSDYAQKTILLSAATGSTVVLPAATGSGITFRFLQTAAAPSAPHVIKVAPTTTTVGLIGDYMIGIINTTDSAATTGYVAANSATVSTNSDTITLSATTSGGLSAGAYIDVQDVLPNTWSVRGITSSSGTAVTPFSAAV